MQIFFRGDGPITFEVESYWTIEKLMEEIILKTNFDCKHQIMMTYNGRYISEYYHRTLYDFNIQREATINLRHKWSAGGTVLNFNSGEEYHISCKLCQPSRDIWSSIIYENSIEDFIDNFKTEKIDINRKRNITVLSYAAYHNKYKIVKFLLDRGANPFVEEDKIVELTPRKLFPVGTALHSAIYGIDVRRGHCSYPIEINMPKKTVLMLSQYVSPYRKNRNSETVVDILILKLNKYMNFVKEYKKSFAIDEYISDIQKSKKHTMELFSNLMRHSLYYTTIYNIVEKCNEYAYKVVKSVLSKDILYDVERCKRDYDRLKNISF